MHDVADGWWVGDFVVSRVCCVCECVRACVWRGPCVCACVRVCDGEWGAGDLPLGGRTPLDDLTR